ncbi:hypothetical protein EST38_g3379 [Candolleomyces aberdarensis]|uniref:Uncharacterized protein n=1 Tax=Candolleomyces aberdarensis TaxID=2316362 RepID=A0A4Q2DQ11_9AGAR|nr:hypothetical protein EST38_g3379 [Candolleomyces aberdarensis]
MPSLFSAFKSTCSFFQEAWFLGSPTWTADNIPDLSGQVFIVTGGNSGLGKDTVRALLEHDARVYIAARDEKKSMTVIDEMFSETGRKAQFLKLDLSSLSSIEAAAAQFLRAETRLDVLFNNAGTLGTPIDVVANGYDMVVFTNLLAKKRLDGTARIINVTSSAHHFAGSLKLETFKDGPERRQVEDVNFFYCQSKFALILMSNELTRRYREDGVISIAVNPATYGRSNGSVPIYREFMISPGGIRLAEPYYSVAQNYCLFWYPNAWGCLTQLWAGVAPEAVHAGGKYAVPWSRIGQPHEGTNDVGVAVKLWIWLEDQVKDL